MVRTALRRADSATGQSSPRASSNVCAVEPTGWRSLPQAHSIRVRSSAAVWRVIRGCWRVLRSAEEVQKSLLAPLTHLTWPLTECRPPAKLTAAPLLVNDNKTRAGNHLLRSGGELCTTLSLRRRSDVRSEHRSWDFSRGRLTSAAARGRVNRLGTSTRDCEKSATLILGRLVEQCHSSR